MKKWEVKVEGRVRKIIRVIADTQEEAEELASSEFSLLDHVGETVFYEDHVEGAECLGDMTPLEIIRLVSSSWGKLYEGGYSGRGMQGDECWAIVTEYPNSVIDDAKANGLRGAKRESLGMSTVVYWPEVKYEEQDGE